MAHARDEHILLETSARSTPGEIFEANADATLIDVRTAAEWAFVGLPTLTTIGKAPLLVAWNEFPSGAQLPDFAGRLKAALAEAEVGPMRRSISCAARGRAAAARQSSPLPRATGTHTTSNRASKGRSTRTSTEPRPEAGRRRGCRGCKHEH